MRRINESREDFRNDEELRRHYLYAPDAPEVSDFRVGNAVLFGSGMVVRESNGTYTLHNVAWLNTKLPNLPYLIQELDHAEFTTWLKSRNIGLIVYSKEHDGSVARGPRDNGVLLVHASDKKMFTEIQQVPEFQDKTHTVHALPADKSVPPPKTGVIYHPVHHYELITPPPGASNPRVGLYHAVGRVLNRLMGDDDRIRDWVLRNPYPKKKEGEQPTADDHRKTFEWYNNLMHAMLGAGWVFFDSGVIWAESEHEAKKVIRRLPPAVLNRLRDWKPALQVSINTDRTNSDEKPVVATWWDLRHSSHIQSVFSKGEQDAINHILHTNYTEDHRLSAKGISELNKGVKNPLPVGKK